MKKYLTSLLLFFCLLTEFLFAQSDSTHKATASTFNFGLGIGLDYGGIGTRFTIIPGKHLMTFAGIGYNFAGAGVNIGLGYLVFPDKRTCPYFAAMYGYNAVIKVFNASQYDEIYYGPSFSVGGQFRNKTLKNYFNLELIIPFRPQEYRNDLVRMKINPQIEVKSEPPPFGVSLGYHFG